MNKKFLYKLGIIFILLKTTFVITYFLLTRHMSVETYSAQEIEELISKIKSSEVIATINKDTKIYSDNELKNLIGTIPINEEVEILQDRSKNVYLVKSNNLKLKGWVAGENLDIPENEATNEEKLTNKEIEIFINTIGLQSETNFLVWVDIDRQLTYILTGKYENWKLSKTFVCATGLNESPTTRGIFKISDKGEWFYSERLESGAKYWVRFNGSYLFHSVAMDKNQQVIDGVLGVRRSSGCVRMGIEDIKWFYENIPTGTTVFIN